jgi:hypothetical protein
LTGCDPLSAPKKERKLQKGAWANELLCPTAGIPQSAKPFLGSEPHVVLQLVAVSAQLLGISHRDTQRRKQETVIITARFWAPARASARWVYQFDCIPIYQRLGRL